MNPNASKTVADFLTADFEYEIQTTVRLIGAVPNENLAWQPDPKAKSALGLMRHLVLEDEWLLNCIANGAFIPPPDDSDACGIMNSADAVAQYQARVPAALARIKEMSSDSLGAVIDMFGMMQMPALSFLSMAAKHSVHHRGQLSTYLRPMGGSIPSVYGPSADTQ